MHYLSIQQVMELGFRRSDINHNLSSGEWKWRTVQLLGERSRRREVLLESLPFDVQVKWLQLRISQQAHIYAEVNQPQNTGSSLDDCLISTLTRLPIDERDSWITEAYRLACIVDRYCRIKPKRWRAKGEDRYEFVPEVISLCQEASCSDPAILVREPHRKHPPSPYTLDDWARSYRDEGLLTFIRKVPTGSPNKVDDRRAKISAAAAHWIDDEWRNFRKPNQFYNELKRMADANNWQIPSKSWLYRLWRNMPKIVETYYLEGEAAYVSKYAPFVPRDYSDLRALQVLCGDHSERDVMFLFDDNTLVRPWLSLWVDLRTWLIWGWYLSLIPSSHTAGLAYADGVMNFGAQPPSRPDDGYYSFVYTDHGRTYKSHQWDGTVISVHEKAMDIDGGLELLLTQRRVGILEEFSIKHLLARPYNAKEKPVERIHRDISDWEENTFPEFCGRDAKDKPDVFRRMYAEHMQFQRGDRVTSPFRRLTFYQDQLATYITRHNSSIHERSTLGGQRIVPLDEYRRLYTTRYDVSRKALALMIMKSDKRVILKDGIQYFRKNWFYYDEALAEFKGMSVEIRYSDDDYTRLWVILPNGDICEASLITPTSLINPNIQTLRTIAKANKFERDLIKNYNLLQHSILRFETTEDRVSSGIESHADSAKVTPTSNAEPAQAKVYKLTRMDRKKTSLSVARQGASPKDVSDAQADDAIFGSANQVHVSEFDGDEGS